MKFTKYHFTPGYTLIVIETLVVSALFTMGFLLGGKPKVAFTISGVWISVFVASLLGSYLRYARYRNFKKDAADK